MIYNLSPREVSILLRAGSVSLIEMQPGTDDDRPLQPPIEPLLLCRREGNQYCLAAAPTAGWQPVAYCRVLSIVRRDIMALDENEARHILLALPALPLGGSYRHALASWWRRQGIADSRVLVFRLAVEQACDGPVDEGQMPAQTAKPLQLWWGVLGVSLLIAAAILGRLQ